MGSETPHVSNVLQPGDTPSSASLPLSTRHTCRPLRSRSLSCSLPLPSPALQPARSPSFEERAARQHGRTAGKRPLLACTAPANAMWPQEQASAQGQKLQSSQHSRPSPVQGGPQHEQLQPEGSPAALRQHAPEEQAGWPASAGQEQPSSPPAAAQQSAAGSPSATSQQQAPAELRPAAQAGPVQPPLSPFHTQRAAGES